MKLKLAVVAALLVVMLVPTAKAGAYIERPPIGEGGARRSVLQYLHKNFPGWRYRASGYVDCRFGRINNYTWTCRVGWVSYGHCKEGRVRVTNEYGEEGSVYYRVVFGFHRC